MSAIFLDVHAAFVAEISLALHRLFQSGSFNPVPLQIT